MIAALSSHSLAQSPASEYKAASSVPGRGVKTPELSLLSVTTLVIWLGCASVGVLGVALPYTRPQLAKAAPPPVQVERLHVELTNEPLPSPGLSAPALDRSAPPPPVAVMQPEPPQPVAVAELSSAVAFAVPVDGPVRIVDSAQAGVTRATTASTLTAGPRAPVQSLVFGRGEGRQPAPTYPARASQLGQEGVVTVQFTVDETGRVVTAEAARPSPWPLLNEAAVRTVRERWRFMQGALRTYEVAIRFHLKK